VPTLGAGEMVTDFRDAGYARIPGVFGPAEIDTYLQEADRLKGLVRAGGPGAGSDQVRVLSVDREDGSTLLRAVQHSHHISPTFDRLRADARIHDILRPLLGPSIKSLLNTLFWKPPGEARTAIAYHQDCAFRRPKNHYRNLSRSYVQLGVALDPHGPENGGMRFVPGSHKLGDLRIERTRSVMLDGPASSDLSREGLEGLSELAIRLAPGDVVIWSAYLLHGSPPNPSPVMDRRFFVAAYMRSSDCDVGDVVFEA